MRWGQAKDLWTKWDQSVTSGRTPADFLGDISDESLIQLLLTCPTGKAHERDIVATETFNRMLRTRERLKEVDRTVGEAAARLTEAVERAEPAVHATERIAKREKKGKIEMMDPEEAIEIAHKASEVIEEVVALKEASREAAEKLSEFRKERLQTGRGGDDPGG